MALKKIVTLRYFLVLLTLLSVFDAGHKNSSLLACTTAVISGRVTPDGRPILWKNRDTTTGIHNELIILKQEKYQAVAVVNAGNRTSVWMGVNEAGFCIENSLSRDLALKKKVAGPGNGRLMKLALETCATVEDFKRLLEKTNQKRSVIANFGVIDAKAGAAIFETGPNQFTFFDANDPKVAPNGYLVRSNFSTTAHGFSASPAREQLKQKPFYSSERYLQACSRLERRKPKGLDIEYIIRNLTRDLSFANGNPIPGTVNHPQGKLPSVIQTKNTISRTTTVSAAVFHGVKQGEDPAWTTMWAILGDPKFSIAVPCWARCESIADPLNGKFGGEIGEIARTLRGWNLTPDREGIKTKYLPGIWTDLWEAEDEIFTLTKNAKSKWRKDSTLSTKMTVLHHQLSEKAIAAMQNEMTQLKQSALSINTPPAPRFSPVTKTITIP